MKKHRALRYILGNSYINNKTLSKMFKDLNDMITDQLVIEDRKAIKNGTVK
jgi:hypothetical protein